MQPRFTLDDAGVRGIVADAERTTNLDLLRSHIYRLVTHRKEMGLVINEISQSRNEMVGIVSTANKVLSEDRSSGLMSILDRKGLVNGLRDELRKQIETNVKLNEVSSGLRKKLNTALLSANQTAELRTAVERLTRELEETRNDHQLASRELQRLQAQLLSPAVATNSPEPAQDNSELTSTIAAQSERIAALEQQLTDAQMQLQASQPSVGASEHAPQAASTTDLEEIQALFSEQVSGYIADNLRLKRELRLAQDAAETLNQSLESLEGALAEAKQAARSADDRATALSAELQASQTTIGALQMEVADGKAENQRHQQEIDALQKTISESRASNGQLQAAFDRKHTELESAGRMISALTSERDQLLENLSRTQGSLNTSEAMNERLQTDIHGYIQQLDSIEAQLKAQIAGWDDERTQLHFKLNERAEQIDRQSNEIHTLQSNVQSLERNLTILNRRSERLIGIKSTLQEALRNLSQDRQRLSNLARDACFELKKVEQEKEQLKLTVLDQETTIGDLTSQLQTSRKVIQLGGPSTRREAEMPAKQDLEGESYPGLDADTSRPTGQF
jgi:chromosome segregation ATPase